MGRVSQAWSPFPTSFASLLTMKMTGSARETGDYDCISMAVNETRDLFSWSRAFVFYFCQVTFDHYPPLLREQHLASQAIERIEEVVQDRYESPTGI